MSSQRRRRAWLRGRRAEHLAAIWLRLKGYRVLARGYRSGLGEIDLIARRGRVLALVEVKARGGMAEAGEAIGRRQQQRIARAAKAFLQRHPNLGALDLRFDAILIAPGRWPRHITDVWRE
jgi:putative endonuclease